MKKFSMFAAAAVACLTLSGCVSEGGGYSTYDRTYTRYDAPRHVYRDDRRHWDRNRGERHWRQERRERERWERTRYDRPRSSDRDRDRDSRRDDRPERPIILRSR